MPGLAGRWRGVARERGWVVSCDGTWHTNATLYEYIHGEYGESVPCTIYVQVDTQRTLNNHCKQKYTPNTQKPYHAHNARHPTQYTQNKPEHETQQTTQNLNTHPTPNNANRQHPQQTTHHILHKVHHTKHKTRTHSQHTDNTCATHKHKHPTTTQQHTPHTKHTNTAHHAYS